MRVRAACTVSTEIAHAFDNSNQEKVIAVHKVGLGVPSLELGKTDVTFTVRKDSTKLGQLHISNGAAVWFSANKQYGYKLSWAKLAQLFEEHGTEKAEKK